GRSSESCGGRPGGGGGARGAGQARPPAGQLRGLAGVGKLLVSMQDRAGQAQLGGHVLEQLDLGGGQSSGLGGLQLGSQLVMQATIFGLGGGGSAAGFLQQVVELAELALVIGALLFQLLSVAFVLLLQGVGVVSAQFGKGGLRTVLTATIGDAHRQNGADQQCQADDSRHCVDV